MKIIFYSNNCPRCKILKQRLKDKKIKYIKSKNAEVLKKHGIMSFPALKVGDKILNFLEAINWLKNQKESGSNE